MARTVTGHHAIEELLHRGIGSGTLLVSRRDERTLGLVELARRRGVTVAEVDDGELSRRCGSTAHRGAALVVERGGRPERGSLAEELVRMGERSVSLALVLDGITDPQNLGAILRSADQFAVDLVVLPARRAARETGTVERVSAGASAYVPLVVVPNVSAALAAFKDAGFWVYGAEGGATPAHRIDLSGRVCIVLGSEGHGMHRLVRDRCDALIAVPAAGHVDSFNVSVAAAILLYEARRQQGFPGAPPAPAGGRGSSAGPAAPR